MNDAKSTETLIQEVARLKTQIDDLKREGAQLRKAATVLEKDQERYKRLLQFLTDYIYTVTIEDGIWFRRLSRPERPR